MPWFLLGWLLGRTTDLGWGEDNGPCYTMADRAALRAERKEVEQPPGLLGWAFILLLVMGGCFMAHSCHPIYPHELTLRMPFRVEDYRPSRPIEVPKPIDPPLPWGPR